MHICESIQMESGRLPSHSEPGTEQTTDDFPCQNFIHHSFDLAWHVLKWLSGIVVVGGFGR